MIEICQNVPVSVNKAFVNSQHIELKSRYLNWNKEDKKYWTKATNTLDIKRQIYTQTNTWPSKTILLKKATNALSIKDKYVEQR